MGNREYYEKKLEIISTIKDSQIKKPHHKDKNLKEAWIKQRNLMMPKTMKKPCPVSPVRLKPGTANLLLDQDK